MIKPEAYGPTHPSFFLSFVSFLVVLLPRAAYWRTVND